MTPREALDRIAGLCDKRATDVHPTRLIDDVRAVLAEVSPEPSGACSCTLTEGDDADSSYVERLIRQDPACPIHRPVLGGVLDRDQARDVLMAFWEHARGPLSLNPDDYLDRLARCVRPAAIDRDALMDLLIRYDVEHPATLGEAADVRAIYVNRILALVRPVAGGAAS